MPARKRPCCPECTRRMKPAARKDGGSGATKHAIYVYRCRECDRTLQVDVEPLAMKPSSASAPSRSSPYGASE